MKPALPAPWTPFVLGSLAVHMFVAAITAARPRPNSPDAAGPIVYESAGGELDICPPGEPDFYLVWPSRPVLPVVDEYGFGEPEVVIACPDIPTLPVCGIGPIDDEQERLEPMLFGYAALRERIAAGEAFDAAYRVPRAHPLTELRR